MNIIGIGELLWDCLPSGKQIGGAPLNFAFHSWQLGAEGYIISAVGRDDDGDELLGGISSIGIDTSFVQRNSQPTSRVDIELNADGVPRYIIHEQVAWDTIEASESALRLVSNADAVCWGSLAQRTEKSRQSILRLIDNVPSDCLKVFDINLRQHYYSKEIIEASLRRANVLKLNEDELPILKSMFNLQGDIKAQLEALIATFDLRYAIFTEGATGSRIVSSKGESSCFPTPKVDVADTVGAGDAFTAAVVNGILNGIEQEKFHRKAVDIAAYVCTCKGAINCIPEKLL